MHIQESGEMYLETILVLTKKNQFVRALDVGEYMGYSKPSVSRAIGLLKNGGYVTSDRDGHLSLTEEGQELAEKIYARHNILSRFLESIGVSKETASEDACKMEHVISDESIEAIEKFINK